ncbi:MAG: hypothetical protein ACD_81C00213G0002 [uncultured bacterium]|uniref:Uncharacterized protein n=1 Tax=Candidatus Wolfebacteria bacterium GW2011_GWC2_39_22 TaxID=1619013 RepID=A0A0G0NJA3_9BACT|nr:MAG: hypothetical protein ACD_81C00213G0002 [uncultured bacterium]KKR12921.1 MAG: hypothetical protein UT41_C0001G0465 [Candidatus Wolfebacteria bacterium GW2011_GWC2_39_22]HBI25423.1 hypothetical protein [Candidatus Wolfebacteria bacterium]
MIIVKIHGVGEVEAEKIRREIVTALSSRMAHKLVTEIVQSKVADHLGDPFPYLECVAPDIKAFQEVQRVVNLLHGRHEIRKMPLIFIKFLDEA